MTIHPGWQEVHTARPWGMVPKPCLVKFVELRFASAPDRGKVKFLDLGCGAGASALYLAEAGYDVLAVDGAPAALSRLKEERAKRNLTGNNLAILLADITEFDMSFGFDCVIDICAIEGLPHDVAKSIIAKAKRWIKHGGWFFSVMAAPGWSVPESVMRGTPYSHPVTEQWVREAFIGYRLKIDREDAELAAGGHTSHWIVQAQKFN